MFYPLKKAIHGYRSGSYEDNKDNVVPTGAQGVPLQRGSMTW
jgi:hypothetical protein